LCGTYRKKTYGRLAASGKARRIEQASYSIWILEQRDKDLLAADNEF